MLNEMVLSLPENGLIGYYKKTVLLDWHKLSHIKALSGIIGYTVLPLNEGECSDIY